MKFFFLQVVVVTTLIPMGCFAKTDGVVRFGGSFIESSCDIYNETERLIVKCFNNHKWTKRVLSGQYIKQNVENDYFSTSYQFIDQEKKLGILTVNYS